MDSTRKNIFDKYLASGGIDSGPKMFSGGMCVPKLGLISSRACWPLNSSVLITIRLKITPLSEKLRGSNLTRNDYRPWFTDPRNQRCSRYCFDHRHQFRGLWSDWSSKWSLCGGLWGVLEDIPVSASIGNFCIAVNSDRLRAIICSYFFSCQIQVTDLRRLSGPTIYQSTST